VEFERVIEVVGTAIEVVGVATIVLGALFGLYAAKRGSRARSGVVW